MSGAIPPLPNTPSWRGARLKEAQGQLYLHLLPFALHEVQIKLYQISKKNGLIFKNNP
jgi:hypothetical protein